MQEGIVVQPNGMKLSFVNTFVGERLYNASFVVSTFPPIWYIYDQSAPEIKHVLYDEGAVVHSTYVLGSLVTEIVLNGNRVDAVTVI